MILSLSSQTTKLLPVMTAWRFLKSSSFPPCSDDVTDQVPWMNSASVFADCLSLSPCWQPNANRQAANGTIATHNRFMGVSSSQEGSITLHAACQPVHQTVQAREREAILPHARGAEARQREVDAGTERPVRPVDWQ